MANLKNYDFVKNEENTYKELEIVADEIISITTKYCGGKSTILK